jgi:hypothetical protein
VSTAKTRWTSRLIHWLNKLDEMKKQPDAYPEGERIARAEVERLQEEGETEGWMT